jgi:hypothetical protein
MRTRWMIGVGIVAAMVLTTGGAAGAATRGVDGTMSGPGGFRSATCAGGTADEFGSGSYAASALGIGTYTFDACITQGGSGFTFSGTAKFVTRSGAKLRGTIGGTFSGSGSPSFTVQVRSGTKRFVRATGSLVLGPLASSNETNCAHGICADFTSSGPVTGTLHHVVKH